MIRLVLLTGFLGTGKTTLMQSILNACENKKVGIIVNEFGEVNIDAVLLKRNGITMAELSNGSIFCACIKDNFLASLIEMTKMDIDYLFIEASGLADPSSMEQILATIEPRTEKKYDYRGAVCVVDAETFPELCDLLPALPRQIIYSSAVIINKADLVDEERICEISDQISQLNPSIHTLVTSYCRCDVKELVDTIRPVEREGEESTNTVETRPKTFILKPKEALPLADLEHFVQELSGSAYRIKGFLPIAGPEGEAVYAVSAVSKRVEIKPWSEAVPVAELVVISSVGIRMISLITKALEGSLKGKLVL